MSFTPRQYQTEISDKAVEILNRFGIVLFSIQVRCGKTFMSLMTAEKIGSKNVLFITKKKAISSIEADYNTLNPDFDITIINYESLHKIDGDFDLVIVDECHSISAFPKPSKRTRDVKRLVGHRKVILMSGTITPESFSQLYHIFWISLNSPFKETNFYKWAYNYVNIKKVYRSHGVTANDYSDAKIEKLTPLIDPYMISYTQKLAGFTSKVEEEVLEVQMLPSTYDLVNILERDLVFEGKNGGVILADTPVKLLNKVTQIYSGTCKLEDGNSVIIDRSKAEFIKEKFNGKKIAIFYKYAAEWDLLKQVFGFNLTNDLEDFNSTGKNIALQIVAGREGISLKNAETLVFFNIDHSATSYFQSRDRMTTKERTYNKVYWIFAKGGIENSIYQTVIKKKSFTAKHYQKTLTV